MLVLSRQRGETVMIGDEIEVTIIDVRGDKVRLGITAPRNVSVHRKEVYDSIKRQQPGNQPGESQSQQAVDASIPPQANPGGAVQPTRIGNRSMKRQYPNNHG